MALNRFAVLNRQMLMHKSSTDCVKLSPAGSSRLIQLSRPSSMNSLNDAMVSALSSALATYSGQPFVSSVILTGSRTDAGRPVFCAGGDVVSLAKAKEEGRDVGEVCNFFAKEYALNHLIGTFPKPIVSILDGITMGGGMGISVHGAFRVCTENTVFAMPETAIGFYPDVGGTFMLPRMERRLGVYLGLTGARLTGIDCYHAGIATHCIPSSRIDSVIDSLVGQPLRADAIDRVLEHFSAGYQPASYKPYLPYIEECFRDYNVEAILARLKGIRTDNCKVQQWAEETIEKISSNSPTATKATAKALQRGEGLTFASCLAMEYALSRAFFSSVADLAEGIRAKLIDKTNAPKWSPADLASVSDDQVDMLLLEGTGAGKHVEFHNDRDFANYLFNYGLPKVSDIRRLVAENKGIGKEALLRGYLEKRNFKMGLRERLEEVFAQHVAENKGQLVWTK